MRIGSVSIIGGRHDDHDEEPEEAGSCEGSNERSATSQLHEKDENDERLGGCNADRDSKVERTQWSECYRCRCRQQHDERNPGTQYRGGSHPFLPAR